MRLQEAKQILKKAGYLMEAGRNTRFKRNVVNFDELDNDSDVVTDEINDEVDDQDEPDDTDKVIHGKVDWTPILKTLDAKNIKYNFEDDRVLNVKVFEDAKVKIISYLKTDGTLDAWNLREGYDIPSDFSTNDLIDYINEYW